MSVTAVFGAVMVVAIALVLVGERSGRRALMFVAKPAASLCFVLVAALRLAAGDRYGTLVLVALVLCLAGDLLLMFPKAFLGGLIAFLLGHLAYVLAFAARLPLSRWPASWALRLAVAAALVLVWLWPRLGRMRFPVVAYVLVISVMVWGASAVSWADGDWRISAGAMLFYLSDLAVARNRFVAPGFVNRAIGLPLYYAGQLLLAFTAG